MRWMRYLILPRACHIFGENESRMERDKMVLTLGPPSSYSFPSLAGPGMWRPASSGSRIRLKRCREGTQPAEKSRSTAAKGCSHIFPTSGPSPSSPPSAMFMFSSLHGLQACNHNKALSWPLSLCLFQPSVPEEQFPLLQSF